MSKMMTLGDLCMRGSSNIAQKDLADNIGCYPIYGASGFIKNVDFYHQENEYVAVVKDGAGIGRTMLLPAKSSVIGTMQYLIPKPESGISTKYLYYAVTAMDLGRYFTGSTIPHIYFRDYSKETIRVPDRMEQDRISGIFEKVDEIIEVRQKQLLELDELVKSRFIEMFGDVYSNPLGLPILQWDDVFNTKTGKLDSNASIEEGKYPFFTCSKEVLRIDKYAFDQEALLLAGNNAAGKYDVKYYKGKFNAYQRTYVLSLKEPWSYQLFQYQLEDKLDYLQQQSLGGLTKYLTLKILGELKFMIPPMNLQNQFVAFVQATDKSKADTERVVNEMIIEKYILMKNVS